MLKSSPLRIHEYSNRLINRIGFRSSLLECDRDFLSHTHQSLTNVSRWLMLTSDFGAKLLRRPPLSPQGVNASALCRDVAWLTEELLFRNKDVGFGGSLAEVMQYSLSLLAPHLIIAAVPSRLVFCLPAKKKKRMAENPDKLHTIKMCCLSKIQFPFQWKLCRH